MVAKGSRVSLLRTGLLARDVRGLWVRDGFAPKLPYMSTLRVVLRRVGVSSFVATSDSGGVAMVRGSNDLESRIVERVADPSLLPSETEAMQSSPMRPMEMFLASLRRGVAQIRDLDALELLP